MEGPDFYPDWAALIRVLSDPGDAVTAFKGMARLESGKVNDEFPHLRARHPKVEAARPIRIQFDLSEPKGDHDHCLYKAKEDTDGRRYAGQRRPEDYQADRAESIAFIPQTLIDPDTVYFEKSRPWILIYVCATGPGGLFVVIVHQREKGEPRYRFITAYPCGLSDWAKKRTTLKVSLRVR